MEGTKRSSWGRVALSMLVCLFVLGLDLGCTPARSEVPPQARRPNILIILTDDQRLAGTMAVLPRVRSWFGDGGRTSPWAFATTPLCCPSRVTIQTGLLAHNHGILNNDGTGRLVFDQEATVQRYLHEAGYRTAIFGKFFNFWRVEDDPSHFDRWAIVSPSRRSNGYRGGTWNVDGRIRVVDRYSTDYIAAQGARFIEAAEADDAQPWFLELAPYAPHLRAVPEPAYEDAPVGPFDPSLAMRESDRSDKPSFVRSEHARLRAMSTARERQLRTLMSVDDLVERIAETLRRTGEARDTLAIFLSDNASFWGEHGLQSKGYPYEAGLRIPFLMRWPGHVEPGSADTRFVATVDVTPTILDAVGISPDRTLDGRSLLRRSWTRTHMFIESWPWGKSLVPEWASLWGRDYQYTEYYADDGTTMFREYYDLRRDPWQLTNLLHDGRPGNDPDVARLHDRLAEDRTCEGTACP
jgi:arylsulfatase A-like enzyme